MCASAVGVGLRDEVMPFGIGILPLSVCPGGIMPWAPTRPNTTLRPGHADPNTSFGHAA